MTSIAFGCFGRIKHDPCSGKAFAVTFPDHVVVGDDPLDRANDILGCLLTVESRRGRDPGSLVPLQFVLVRLVVREAGCALNRSQAQPRNKPAGSPWMHGESPPGASAPRQGMNRTVRLVHPLSEAVIKLESASFAQANSRVIASALTSSRGWLRWL